MAAHLSRVVAALCLLAVVLGASAEDPRPTNQARKSAPAKTPKLAHFRLHGELDESPVLSDPLFGSVGENFKMKLDRIAKAIKDPDVQGLVIYLDGVEGGWAKVQELRRAMAAAQKAGKKVYAYL